MAVSIAKLSSILTLDVSKFSAPLAKVRTDISAFSAISIGAFSRVGGMGIDAIRRVVGVLPAMVKQSLDAGDALNEMAMQLGFSTDHLANLQRVAGLAGIELSALESMIGKMNATLGEAMAGNKTAADSFTALGLNIQSLASKKPEETFYAILDALKAIPTVAQKSSAAMAVFGRSGRGVLKLAAGGSRGLIDEMLNTRRLGLATKPADLAKMDATNDTLADLKNNLKGFSDQLALKASPHLTALGDSFLKHSIATNLAAKAAGEFASILKVGVLSFAKVVDFAEKWFPIPGLSRPPGSKSRYDSANEAFAEGDRREQEGPALEPWEPTSPGEHRAIARAQRYYRNMLTKQRTELARQRREAIYRDINTRKLQPSSAKRAWDMVQHDEAQKPMLESPRGNDDVIRELRKINQGVEQLNDNVKRNRNGGGAR